MGIPAYFAYLIKNYQTILKPRKKCPQIQAFFLDCNSIIYDVVYAMNIAADKIDVYSDHHSGLEEKIIERVIDKINAYLKEINPTKFSMIAFDGVAPVAKLEQQRMRRYRSAFLAHMFPKQESGSITTIWDTASITPGTVFMNKLSEKLKQEYSERPNVILSTSEEPGEGEHKLFQHLRSLSSDQKPSNYVVYGLDADLIMLSLCHLDQTLDKNEGGVYLYRETPEYIQNINRDIDPTENYFVDVRRLAAYIIEDMMGGFAASATSKGVLGYLQKEQKTPQEWLMDYIFMCFMLGNDFLPHFPSLNIRTVGINVLSSKYAELMEKNRGKFTLTRKRQLVDSVGGGIHDIITTPQYGIHWPHVHQLLVALAEDEHRRFLEEHQKRNRMEKRRMPETTPKEREDKFNQIPILSRTVEHFIDPENVAWQMRYYDALFNEHITELDSNPEEFIHKVSQNYLEGLEWTFHYYTDKCLDWSWKYHFHYPPLFADLIYYCPVTTTGQEETTTLFQWDGNVKPVDPRVQLSYVLPKKAMMKLIAPSMQNGCLANYLVRNHPDWYPDTFDNVKWAYCRYFWESHIVLPDIPLDELSREVAGFTADVVEDTDKDMMAVVEDTEKAEQSEILSTKLETQCLLKN